MSGLASLRSHNMTLFVLVSLDYVWLLVGFPTLYGDDREIVAGIVTVLAYGGSLTQSINHPIN